MTKYNLTIYSKNKNSINYFLQFLQNSINKQNFQVIKKLLKKKKIQNKLSILKSPHVNKTAQEHFEYRNYSIKISCNSWDIKKYFFILKKIKNQLFPDIHIKIEIKTYFKKKKKSINLNKILLFIQPLNIKKDPNQFSKILLYLKALDYYGETKK
jgi:ribosomal protein S10